MKLNKHEIKYKEALATQRELNALYNERWQIAPIKLDTPIHHGYIRSIELTSDAKRRDDYLKLKAALELCGVKTVFSIDNSFIVLSTKKQKIELHAGIKTISDPRRFRYISDAYLERKMNEIFAVKKYLYECNNFFSCDCGKNKLMKDFIPHFVFKYTQFTHEVTHANYLTHYTPINIEIESKIKKLNDVMYQNHYYELLYGKWSSSWDKYDKSVYSEEKYKFDKTKLYHSID